MRSHTTLFLISAVTLLSSCNQAQQSKPVDEAKKPEQKKEKPATDRKEYNNMFNNVSGIISGMQESTNSLNYLYDSLPWKENKALIDSNWKKLEAARLVPMQNWSKTALAEANKNSNVVFYPFSGPDFLTSNAFFPNAQKVIMLGLEPVGALPKIDRFSAADGKDYCNDFKRSLTEIFERSYFITEYMLRDFQKQKVNGLMPVLCLFVKRTGHQITNIQYMVRQSKDSIAEKPYTTTDKPFGVKITCVKNDTVKTIYYFRYDVSNKQFNDTCVFYKFINKHTPNSITYIKSASYLLHANFMSNMRDLILKNSNYVLEDDTGIPYNYFSDSGKWNIQLYGQYVKPIKNFPYLKMQKGIMEAYKKDSASVPAIPFHLGYHWKEQKDVLIYAVKK